MNVAYHPRKFFEPLYKFHSKIMRSKIDQSTSEKVMKRTSTMKLLKKKKVKHFDQTVNTARRRRRCRGYMDNNGCESILCNLKGSHIGPNI
ncbi:hypothetical protein QJS04_geneDACA003443 [Acorus gramineus]|uniref:Uncharacterized protein n=1 Tax=Acorus gramineus TaxID=55184 RepID=A0AAV9BMI5_ACOGR|nr:hypothetical protein QJS04_geneDACA003443 [Acorus gramineus]